MGCCSSSNTISPSVSPANQAATTTQNRVNSLQQNTELVDHHRLQQHQDGTYGQSESSEDELPRSFTNNQSIVKEVMRLEELEMGTESPHMEIKSNENSEELQFMSNDGNHDQSFGEFGPHKNAQESYHPFGLIPNQKESSFEQTHENDETDDSREDDNVSKKEILNDLEALYEDNLKGFDADKFRSANALMTEQNDTQQRSMSADVSSFASSQMSSQIPAAVSTSQDTNTMNDIHEYLDEEEEDFMMEELSRSIVNPLFQNKTSPHDEVHYLENFKHSVKKDHEINNVMDDQDEELMDAILSLDLED